MEPQWQPNSTPPVSFDGPSFRRGEFVAASQQAETQLRWSIFRLHDDGTFDLLPGEYVQDWNSAESVEFPRQWADGVISKGFDV
jgi:hypothetical protein